MLRFERHICGRVRVYPYHVTVHLFVDCHLFVYSRVFLYSVYCHLSVYFCL